MLSSCFQIRKIKKIGMIFCVALVAWGFITPAVFADDCKNLARQIQGDFDAIQANGGLWAFMERVNKLRDKSMIGLQVDSKIQRAVSHVKNKCIEGTPPTNEYLADLGKLIDTSRQINNKRPDRTPAKKLLEMIETLIKDVDGFLAKHNI